MVYQRRFGASEAKIGDKSDKSPIEVPRHVLEVPVMFLNHICLPAASIQPGEKGVTKFVTRFVTVSAGVGLESD